MRRLRALFLRMDGTVRPGWKAGLFLALDGLLRDGLSGALVWAGIRSYAAWLWSGGAATLALSCLFLACEGRSVASLGLRFGRKWGCQALLGAGGGVAFMGLVALAARLSGGFHWTWAEGGAANLAPGAWLFLAVAFREEILFRGYAFQRLVEGTGRWPALLLASAYFAYAHWDNPGMAGSTRAWAMLNIGLAGTLMGLAWLKTRSLAMPMGIHWGWNWAQGSLLGFGVSGIAPRGLLEPVFHGGPAWLTGGAFGLEASLPCAAFGLLALLALARWKGAEA